MTETLDAILRGIERGVFPPTDLGITLVDQPSERDAAVLATTAHVIVAAEVDQQWLSEHLPPCDPGAAFNPPFLRSLELRLGRRVNNIDVMTLATALQGPPDLALKPVEDQIHPRVRRALRHRRNVRVWTCEGGVIAVGEGLAGRWEVGLEVDEACRGMGLGRAMAKAARHLVPEDRPIWAQVAPGNAASLRAFLAAGFVLVGQEALLVKDH